MDEMKNSRLLPFHISAIAGQTIYGTDTHIFLWWYIRPVKYCADSPENVWSPNYEYSLKADDKLNSILKCSFPLITNSNSVTLYVKIIVINRDYHTNYINRVMEKVQNFEILQQTAHIYSYV
jgi:hypothetical protein